MTTIKRTSGFTLVELLVTVVIIAVLASVVYPVYTAQVMKARRTEARVALNEIALAQERYFTVNGTYGTEDELGAAYDDAINKMTDRNGDGVPDYYTIAMAPDDPTTTFTLTATATGAQADDDDCDTFGLNQAGARTATGDHPDKCW